MSFIKGDIYGFPEQNKAGKSTMMPMLPALIFPSDVTIGIVGMSRIPNQNLFLFL